MMDRIQTSVISVLICAAMVFCFPFSASAESYDYIFTYKLNTDGTAKITGYEGNPIHMVIPAEIDGYSVTEVGSNAFAVNAEELYNDADCYCPVEVLEIVEGITDIRSGAFRNCKNLKAVFLPESLERIDFDAFLGCDALTSMTLPQNISFIDDDAIGYSYVSDFSPDRWEYEWWGEPMDDFTICGYTGTAAETYANENGFTFIALDEQTTTTTDPIATTTTTMTTTVESQTQTSATTLSTLCGDVNLDRDIDLRDAVLLQKYAVEMVEFDPQQIKNGDCNGDGQTDAQDAASLMRFLVQMTAVLPEINGDETMS